MFNPKSIALACACAAAGLPLAQASQQAESNGFIADSSLNILLRNAYYNRDFKNNAADAKVWGQGFIGTFESGFTQGTVGFGVDAFGLLGVKLDSGRGRNYSAFFDTDSQGRPVDDLSQAGAAVKLRFSNTVIRYGNQFPSLPVLAYDDSRLLPQSFTGTLVTSNEIEGLELNAGRFTADSPMGDPARDPNRLKNIDVVGGSYLFSDNLSAALYHSDVEDVYEKYYANLTYNLPLTATQALNFDFNLYRTDYDDNAEAALDLGGDGRNDRNTIWSLAAKYSLGAHAFILAHQRNSGDAGFAYDYGDGGSSIYLANSYYSDFNLKDERSWQASYELDFTDYGMPGLRYKFAYVRGDNIDTGADSDGSEREIFNQVSYVVQNGPAKDLSLRLRNSIYRSSNEVGPDLNEIRAFVEYPLSIL
ncbi:OprD family porin [Phytopseudomonas dryadis]|uniref:Outer membrane porin, OprD family n=1 Tax=Phytopseudomonas dryadis TaxID=2487520 RepID=A0A4Q9R9X5_9GAMM|nr:MULTISPECIES: OprD family porin [Pseudomonas]TBU97503.1 outer membrane porin, OprD family [Pseudomonas dryadis]TBV09975.1 outer membrane porin, OprD family [Pseudomonas dryadis]TBV15618.1 outer membrane porin, OprD family [Pseudomonas sp. FRB 230]